MKKKQNFSSIWAIAEGINGRSIAQIEVDEVEYWHVERRAGIADGKPDLSLQVYADGHDVVSTSLGRGIRRYDVPPGAKSFRRIVLPARSIAARSACGCSGPAWMVIRWISTARLSSAGSIRGRAPVSRSRGCRGWLTTGKADPEARRF